MKFIQIVWMLFILLVFILFLGFDRRPGHGQGVGGAGLGGRGRRDGRGADLGGRETAKLSGENGLSGCQRVPQVCRLKFERSIGVGL